MRPRNKCHCPCHHNHNIKHIVACCSGDRYDIIEPDPKKVWGALTPEQEAELDEVEKNDNARND